MIYDISYYVGKDTSSKRLSVKEYRAYILYARFVLYSLNLGLIDDKTQDHYYSLILSYYYASDNGFKF